MLPVLIIGGIYMKKIRVYELAKDLDISSKELIDKIQELGMEVSSHMSTVENEDAKLITSLLTDSGEETEEDLDEDLQDEEEIGRAHV